MTKCAACSVLQARVGQAESFLNMLRMAIDSGDFSQAAMQSAKYAEQRAEAAKAEAATLRSALLAAMPLINYDHPRSHEVRQECVKALEEADA